MRRFILVLGAAWCMGPTCQSSDTGATADEPSWFLTCGDPVCQDYSGPFAGVDLCSDSSLAVGDPCTAGELDDTCDPVDSCNALLICAESDPTQQTSGCPISRAKHKTDIAYLDAAQRSKAHDHLLKMKLATWRYRPGLDDGAEHMGFLIDDVPGSPAVRPDGEHVDLYGYTSLAVAAIQEQQAQIAALEARLAKLEQACAE